MPMEQLSFQAGAFEGPLDALLFLIARHKMQIWDIRIADLLDQYMALVAARTQQDLEMNSDFLEMAARLVHIKTLALLPRHEEEAERLRGELTGELIEYHLCRLVAGALREMIHPEPRFVRQEAPLPVLPYTHHHDADQLAAAYLMATGRRQQRMPPPAERFTGIVGRRFVPVSVRIRFLLRQLSRNRSLDYHALFAESERSEQVATFMALLELIKAGRVKMAGDGRRITLAKGGPKTS